MLFAARELAAPRARYVRADPQPRANLPTPPSAVTVTFTEPLGEESAIDVISTVVVLPSGEKSYGTRRKVTTTSGIDPDDRGRTTLRAQLERDLPAGIYLVDWRAYTARGNSLRFGSFYFGVGTPVPVRAHEGTAGVTERDYRRRGRRFALVGGIALILFAVVLPVLPRKG